MGQRIELGAVVGIIAVSLLYVLFTSASILLFFYPAVGTALGYDAYCRRSPDRSGVLSPKVVDILIGVLVPLVLLYVLITVASPLLGLFTLVFLSGARWYVHEVAGRSQPRSATVDRSIEPVEEPKSPLDERLVHESGPPERRWHEQRRSELSEPGDHKETPRDTTSHGPVDREQSSAVGGESASASEIDSELEDPSRESG